MNKEKIMQLCAGISEKCNQLTVSGLHNMALLMEINHIARMIAEEASKEGEHGRQEN